MAGLLLVLAVGLAITIAWSIWFTMHRLRRPPRRTYASAVSAGLPADPSELPSPRAFREWSVSARVPKPIELPVWEIEGDDPSGPVMILSPGWGDSRIGALTRVDALAGRASMLVAWDPPGQGEAPGRSLLGAHDAAILEALMERLDSRDTRFALYGWSLGAGSSIAAAAQSQDRFTIDCVIAEAPYRVAITPARNVIRLSGLPHRINLRPAMWLLGLRLGVGPGWRGFDRAELARGVRCPLLVLHGSEDPICPLEDGRAIAEAAPRGRLEVIEGAAHNDLWAEGFADQCAERVGGFLEQALTDTPDGSDG